MKTLNVACEITMFLMLASSTASADILVASAGANSIFRYDQSSGSFLQKFDNTSAQSPAGMAFGPDGFLYTATTNAANDFNSHIDRFDPTTGKLLFSFGALPQTRGMTVGPDGLIYVSAFNVNQIWRYNSSTGAFVDVFVASVPGGCTFCGIGPHTMTFGPDGNLYVCMPGADSVLKFNGTTGALISTFISESGLSPSSIVFGPDGNIYLGSSVSFPNQIRRYNGSTGAFDKVFASSANLASASSMAFGPDGNLYVGSSLTASVVRFNGSTGAFIDTFIPGGFGGLGINLTGLLFTGTGQTVVAPGLPHPTPDPGQITFTLNFPTPGTIASMELFFQFTYQCERDLTMDMVAPDGQTVRVMDHGLMRCSGVATTFTSLNTQLGQSQFFGGHQAQGTWQLIVTDDTAGNSGTMDVWRLTIATTGPAVGTINVTTNLPVATFTITGPQTYSGRGISFVQPNAPAGTYTITFSGPPRYRPPVQQSAVLSPNGSISFSGMYQFPVGMMTVNTNLSGVAFTVTGPSSFTGLFSGKSLDYTLPIGSYTVSFAAEQGYSGPSPQTVLVVENKATPVSGTYTLLSGTGTVVVTVNAPYAGFEMTGPIGFSGVSSKTFDSAPPGEYHVQFLPSLSSGLPKPPVQDKTLFTNQTVIFSAKTFPTTIPIKVVPPGTCNPYLPNPLSFGGDIVHIF